MPKLAQIQVEIKDTEILTPKCQKNHSLTLALTLSPPQPEPQVGPLVKNTGVIGHPQFTTGPPTFFLPGRLGKPFVHNFWGGQVGKRGGQTWTMGGQLLMATSSQEHTCRKEGGRKETSAVFFARLSS